VVKKNRYKYIVCTYIIHPLGNWGIGRKFPDGFDHTKYSEDKACTAIWSVGDLAVGVSFFVIKISVACLRMSTRIRAQEQPNVEIIFELQQSKKQKH